MCVCVYVCVYVCISQPVGTNRMWQKVKVLEEFTRFELSFPSRLVNKPRLKSLMCPTNYK